MRLVILAVYTLLFTLPAQGQSANTSALFFEGVWNNIRLEKGHLSTLEIEHNTPRAQWQMRARTKCAPRDCTWGYEAGTLEKDGTLTVTFNTFIATRTLILKRQASRLRVSVTNTYRGKDKPATTRNYILTRETP